jgi:hypothetical protein
MLSNIFVSGLTPCVGEITGDYQCGFIRNRSTIDQIIHIRQVLEKRWECNGKLHQSYIDFERTNNSVRREVLYSVTIAFGILMRLVRTNNMCLNDTYNEVCIGK